MAAIARLEFEVQAVRDRDGDLATGVVYTVYSDEAATSLADISATSGGSAIAGSTVVVADIAGLGPSALRWWGPPAATDELYLKTPSDPTLPVQKVEAVTDQRLDALEAAVDALEAAGTQVWAIDPEQTPYNADGTGGTDTYTAWTTAISDAISQKRPIVSKPGKTYRINAKLTISGSVVIDLNGSSIKKGAALNDWALEVTGADVTLRNVVIDGNRSGGALLGGIHWTGARGKAYDCDSSHTQHRGWYVTGAGATLDAYRCVGSDNVYAASGIGAGQGFAVESSGLLRTFDCEAHDNDYVGFFLTPSAADGCRLSGQAHRNAHAGARIEGNDGGTSDYFYAEDNNGYGILMVAHPDSWIFGTVKVRGTGNAIAAFSLAASETGTGVELFGASDCSFDVIDSREMSGYALAFVWDTSDNSFKSVRNHVGTVIAHREGQASGDPAVIYSNGASHNHIGTLIANSTTLAANFGEADTSSVPVVHNTIGTLIADECAYGAVKFDLGHNNYIGRVIARNVGTADTTNVAKGVIQFGSPLESIAVTGNAVGWLENDVDPALGTTPPAYLAHAIPEATGNRVEGGYPKGFGTAVSLDDNGGNTFTFLQPRNYGQTVPSAREPFPRYIGGNSLAPATGVMNVTAFTLQPGDVVSSLWFLANGVMTMGTNVDGHIWAAMYNSSLTLMAQSTDLGGAATWGAGTWKQFTLTATQAITTPGLYYVGLLIAIGTGGSPAMPTIRGGTYTTTALAAGPTGSKILAGTNGSGLTTTAPAGPITLTSNAAALYFVTNA